MRPFSAAEAQAKADESNRELDELDRELEAMKAHAGKCFGRGEGRTVEAEMYSNAKGRIAEQRNVVKERLEELLAMNTALEQERTNFERWRAENREHLVRHVGGMKLEVVWVARRDLFGRPASETLIVVEATNTTTDRILKPTNRVGRLLSIGASLTDSFGNNYQLMSITPPFLGNEAQGIRPGSTVTFELRFGDVPLQNAESVRLAIEPATLGQRAGTAFVLPSEAFYGTL